MAPEEILTLYRVGRTPPMQVLEVLLELFNALHTSLQKSVAYKTREERAQFLRRFFRDLKRKAGFKTLPDPRNFGHRHVQAMMTVWQREQLAAGTIQTYLSYLRALAMWLGKHGLVRQPEHYGLKPPEYQRTGSAQRDKSWTGQGIAIEAVMLRVSDFDRRVGASLRLALALGLRLKESVMFRPYASIVTFEETGLPPELCQADSYARVKEGSKGGRLRLVPLDSEARLAAVKHAKSLVAALDAHLGDPEKSLKQNMRRFSYVMEKFGITQKMLGATAHGLRHEALNDHYKQVSGQPSPVRGGGPVPSAIDRTARSSVARLAGHGRRRASNAYLGSVRGSAASVQRPSAGAERSPMPRGTGDPEPGP